MDRAMLHRLLQTPAPSSAEAPAARMWREAAREFADEVYADVHGTSYAVLLGEKPRVMLAGHIDEIGIMVTYIDEQGFLSFDAIGGWDVQVLVGQRVRLQGRQGEVIGVIGRPPIHTLESDEREKAPKIHQLWIDIGVRDAASARELVRVGTVGVIDAPVYELPNDRFVSRSLDNRIGSFIVLEALRLLAADRPPIGVTAVAAAQEEIGGTGALTAAYRLKPAVALVVDVTFTTDTPQSSRARFGDVSLGSGVVLSPGSANSPLVLERLVQIAEEQQIPYTMQAFPRFTSSDADEIVRARRGVATAVLSVPCRYLHSPNEMVAMADVAHIIRLITAFVPTVQTEDEFIPG